MIMRSMVIANAASKQVNMTFACQFFCVNYLVSALQIR